MRVEVMMCVVGALAGTAHGLVVSNTTHGATSSALDGSILANDVLAGLIPTELPADNGWHPANPAATNGSLDPHGLPAFTDGLGGSGLIGLLNDFPTSGTPTKSIEYDLGGAFDIPGINILTGNDGKDGRVYSTTVVRYSTNNGGSFSTLGYFQSDPSGTINSGQWGSTLVEIFDDSGAPLVAGATNLQFDFYCVDNTSGQMRDPFDGVNPFTGVDDGLTSAFVGPLLWEIDVVPSPGTLGVVGMPGLLLGRRRRRTA
jgi:hypothetical protein